MKFFTELVTVTCYWTTKVICYCYNLQITWQQ